MKSENRSSARHSSAQPLAGSKLHAADWVVESGAVDDVLLEMESKLRGRRRRRWRAVTGGLVALLLVGGVWHQTNQTKSFAERSSESSAVVSLPERQVLSDGSIVELRDGAEVAAAFTDSVRRVVLLRGEAHFEVAKLAKPFVVAVDGVDVRAVGTAFSVQRGGTQVEVLVTEGTVAVGQATNAIAASIDTPPPTPDSAAAQVVRVEAGSRVVVSMNAAAGSSMRPEVSRVEPAELAQRLAWRAPKLEFSRTPLMEALALMNQNASAGKNVTVTLADPSLGGVRVSGVLRADNIETLLAVLAGEHGIKAEYGSPNEIVLRKGR